MRLTTYTMKITALILILFILPSTQGGMPRPNIVVIMVDDMGWNDVGSHSKEMNTTNIDNLGNSGVKMNFSYMLKSCTPSRSSFLTGYYAYRMGLQHLSLGAGQNDSLPLDKRLFPQDLKDNGYSTHLVGKWHLGFCRREMTPTYRGFHTFYGMYNGAADHYTHKSNRNGYDLQNNTGFDDFKADLSANGTYSTELFTKKAVDIIKSHDVYKPLFLFLSYQAVHAPFQVPEHFIQTYCAHVNSSEKRQIQCGMMAAIDEGVGNVTEALKDRGLDKNLIILFISDNGGPTKHGSSNWPLRGGKVSNWEGGTRVITYLHSQKYLPSAPYTWNGLMHAVDWYPTLLRAANISANTSGMDGIDNWDRIVKNEDSNREEFVYNLNQAKGNYALRWKQYKLAKFKSPNPDGWLNPPPGVVSDPKPNKTNRYMLFDIEQDPTEHNDLATYNKTYRDIKKHMKRKLREYKKGLASVRTSFRYLSGLPPNSNGTWTTDWC